MEDYLPLSYINQFAYCPRRFWYMCVQGEMVENVHVLRGVQNHARANTPGYETMSTGVRIHRRLHVVSHELRVSGICDLVEEHPDGSLRPVEYKQGRQGKWHNDQAQLCAQAICLAEMTGRPVNVGQIFYFGSRHRLDVQFDAPLQALTRQLVTAMHHALAEGIIPPHTEKRARCRGCSLIEICLPEETDQLVRER